jgi:hypothetical protein
MVVTLKLVELVMPQGFCHFVAVVHELSVGDLILAVKDFLTHDGDLVHEHLLLIFLEGVLLLEICPRFVGVDGLGKFLGVHLSLVLLELFDVDLVLHLAH